MFKGNTLLMVFPCFGGHCRVRRERFPCNVKKVVGKSQPPFYFACKMRSHSLALGDLPLSPPIWMSWNVTIPLSSNASTA